MSFFINDLLDDLLFRLRTLKPKYCRQFDDPRIDTLYISINPHNFIVLSGVCDECDSITIYNNNNIKYDIMTDQGIENFVNHDESRDTIGNIIFELELDTFDGTINDLLLVLTNAIKEIVPY